MASTTTDRKTQMQEEYDRVLGEITGTLDDNYDWLIQGEGYQIRDKNVLRSALRNDLDTLHEDVYGRPDSMLDDAEHEVRYEHAIYVVDKAFSDYEVKNGELPTELYDQADFYSDVALEISERTNVSLFDECAKETTVFATAIVGDIEQGEFQDAIGEDFDWSDDRREYARRVLNYLGIFTESNLDKLTMDLENTPSDCLWVQVVFTTRLATFTDKMGEGHDTVSVTSPALICGNVATGGYGLAPSEYEGTITVAREELTVDAYGVEECYGTTFGENSTVTVA